MKALGFEMEPTQKELRRDSLRKTGVRAGEARGTLEFPATAFRSGYNTWRAD
jgi:hypothetical protein